MIYDWAGKYDCTMTAQKAIETDQHYTCLWLIKHKRQCMSSWHNWNFQEIKRNSTGMSSYSTIRVAVKRILDHEFGEEREALNIAWCSTAIQHTYTDLQGTSFCQTFSYSINPVHSFYHVNIGIYFYVTWLLLHAYCQLPDMYCLPFLVWRHTPPQVWEHHIDWQYHRKLSDVSLRSRIWSMVYQNPKNAFVCTMAYCKIWAALRSG